MDIRILLLSGMVLLFSGCSGGGNGDAADAGQAAASTSQAGSSHGECELPAEYEKMPVVPECFHVSDYSIAVQASTTLNQAEVLAFFDRALPEAGWNITGREEMEEGLMHLDLEGHGARSAWVEVKKRQSENDRAIGVTYYVN